MSQNELATCYNEFISSAKIAEHGLWQIDSQLQANTDENPKKKQKDDYNYTCMRMIEGLHLAAQDFDEHLR
jgi:hypothetical protein